MTRVFIEMYFDEDVSDIAARSLRNRGYRVLTTQATARKRATDAEQLAYAASQNLTLVTHAVPGRQEEERWHCPMPIGKKHST